MRNSYTSIYPSNAQSPVHRMLISLFYLMAGVRGVAAIVQLGTLLFSGFTTIRLTDGLVNLALAGLCVWCARTLTQRNRLVIPGFALISLAAMVYAYSVGRGFSFGVFGLLLFFLAGASLMQRRGEFRSVS